MLPLLTKQFQSLYDELRPGGGTVQTFSYLGVRGTISEHFASFFIFADREESPLCRVKVARDARGVQQLSREGDILGTIARTGSPFLTSSLPRSLVCGDVAGQWVLVETAPAGGPLGNGWGSAPWPPLERFTETLEGIGRWLARFHRESRGALQPEDATVRTRVPRTLEQFVGDFELSPDARSWASVLAETCRQGGQHAWRPIFAHGDFGSRNIFGSTDQPVVVNWHLGDQHAPLHDIFNFILGGAWSEQTQESEGLLAWAGAALLEETPYSKAARSCLEEYCRLLGLRPDAIGVYLGLYVAHSAIRAQEIGREAREAGLRWNGVEGVWVTLFETLARAVVGAQGPYAPGAPFAGAIAEPVEMAPSSAETGPRR